MLFEYAILAALLNDLKVIEVYCCRRSVRVLQFVLRAKCFVDRIGETNRARPVFH